MADTIRDRTTIIGTTLADNTTGDISPQDLRDVVVSSSVYGGMVVKNAGGSVTQAYTSTPAKVTFWNADLPSYGVVPDSTTDNDLTVPTGGAGDYDICFFASFSVSNTSANRAEFRLRVNAVETNDGCYRSITATTVGTTGFSTIYTLADGDVVTVYVESGSASSYNLEIYDAVFSMRRLA